MVRIPTQHVMSTGPRDCLPTVSLIIPSRNRPELLLDTVQSILRGDEVPTELVVIDQSDAPHPTLATLTTDRACEIRYLWTQSVGLSRAWNAGIAAARHAILAFIDDDELVTPAWFATIVRALVQAGPRSVVTGRVLPTEAETPGGFAPSTIIDEVPAIYQGRVGKGVLYSNNMVMYRSAIDEVGPFDTRLGSGASFPTSADNDLGFHLLEAGYRIIYTPEAVVYHRAWRGDDDYLPLRWRYGVGRGGFYAKHLSLRDRYMLWRMVWDIKAHTFLFLRHVWHERRRAYGDAVLALGILSGAARWLLTQRKTS
jgi:GT2 family glycosyltransferase